ncbi:myelin-associated glycoprotein-like isoform X2 [Megalobrama amblycephala]|nr:myelin-associated glycoprotein-like isoform X2 [Megalobrama amblycephala]XP_048029702.1 myelin-associated glycoprotein-like isoform X2 [Megalobrama amblycephala]
MLQITFFTIIIIAVQHTHSADDLYSAVMPQTVTALTGSCVQIPCTFTISNFEDKLKKTKFINGIWLKNKQQFDHSDSFIAFNSSKNIIRGFSDIQITGNLTERNCTTVFYNIMKNHSDLYYFRLEMEPNVFRATFNPNQPDSRKTVNISVINSPQPPELKPNDQRYVMENTTVNLSCSAEAPCPKQPPTISWSNIPESAHITTQLQEKPDKTQSVFSHMIFKASYMDHRRNISCTATYPRKTSNDSTVETTVMLRVLFPPKETHITIDPSASVSVGTNVTLTCKSKAVPLNQMSYTWYKRGYETPIARGKRISFVVTHNNTGLVFCTAQNKHGKQSSAEIQLTAEGQDGLSVPLIAGCVGGIVAVLTLSALGFCTRTKKFNKPSDNEKDPSGQVNITDVDYVNTARNITINEQISDDETMIIYYENTDIPKQKNCCITETHFKHDEYTEIEYRVFQVL